jgi:hypothetical protein
VKNPDRLPRHGYGDPSWSEAIPPEDSAPAPADPAERPDLVSWGRTQEEARDMLARQMCPACGEGPWKSPLNHASKRHGIDGRTMREVCGLTTVASVASPELADRISARMKGEMTPDRAASLSRRRSGARRWTEAGRSAVVNNLSGVTAEQSRESLQRTRSPEAIEKRSETLRAKWGAMTPEQRRERSKQLRRSSEDLTLQGLAMWDKRGRQPCGTVASYKRGCRCEECREAKRRSR